MTNYYASRYDYFIQIPALAIVAPQGENPGDVYSEPGTIAKRKVVCFPQLSATVSKTRLASARIDKNSEIAGRVRVNGRRGVISGTIEGDVDVKIRDEIKLDFGQPIITSALNLYDIAEILNENPPENNCIASLVSRLGRDVGDSVQYGIPWIILRVWYATETVSVRTVTVSNAETRVKVEAALRSLEAEAGLRHTADGDAFIVSHTASALPVAWRPAFISERHLDQIRQLRERENWFDWLLNQTPFFESDVEILEVLRQEFQIQLEEVIPKPDDILLGMSALPAVPFEMEREEHLQYIRALGAFLAVSYEVHGA